MSTLSDFQYWRKIQKDKEIQPWLKHLIMKNYIDLKEYDVPIEKVYNLTLKTIVSIERYYEQQPPFDFNDFIK